MLHRKDYQAEEVAEMRLVVAGAKEVGLRRRQRTQRRGPVTDEFGLPLESISS